MLPTHEDISIGKTKNHVSIKDIENFNSWTNSLNDVVKPFEEKSKTCNIRNIIEEGHVIERSIDLLNEEIIRMIQWTRRDQSSSIERSAKNYKDIRDRYMKARDILQNECDCKKR